MKEARRRKRRRRKDEKKKMSFQLQVTKVAEYLLSCSVAADAMATPVTATPTLMLRQFLILSTEKPMFKIKSAAANLNRPINNT